MYYYHVSLDVIVQNDDQIRMDLLNALDRYYPSNNTMEYDEDLNDVIDFIQETLECCGVNNTEDWLATPYYDETDSLPSSCCDGEPEECFPEGAYDKVSIYMWFMVLINKSPTINSALKAGMQISLRIVP